LKGREEWEERENPPALDRKGGGIPSRGVVPKKSSGQAASGSLRFLGESVARKIQPNINSKIDT